MIPTFFTTVGTALHVLQCITLLMECLCWILGRGRMGHCTHEEKGTLLLTISRVNWDSGPVLEFCPLPSQNNVSRWICPAVCTQEILRSVSTALRPSVPASLIAWCAGWPPNPPQKQQGIMLLLQKDICNSAMHFKLDQLPRSVY